jgi:predicted nucleotidyltransferase
MLFGLTKKEIDAVKSVFEKTPGIESVFIYGSRAKGNFKKTSDIDLGVRFAENAGGDILKLKSALGDLPVIYEIDALDEKEIAKGSFETEYEKTKQLFWEKSF